MIFNLAYVLLFMTCAAFGALVMTQRKFRPATRRARRVERRMSSTTVYLGITCIVVFIVALTTV